MMRTIAFRTAWSVTLLTILAAIIVAFGTFASQNTAEAAGAVVFDGSPGTAAPPATLGPHTMTPFADDSRLVIQNVTNVPAPNGGELEFDRLMSHREIGGGWATWSHGYTGDVYFSNGDSQVVMTLPANTLAFYFYAEPNNFATFNVTATTSDGTSSGPVAVTGDSGAKYFGFYTTDGSALSAITVDVDPGASGFAVGEFGIANRPCGSPTKVAQAGTPTQGEQTADVILGSALADEIFGNAGNDTICGRQQADKLFGGTDNDKVFGEEGNDLIFGQAGNDILDGGADDDRLRGDAGRDSLEGEGGDDTLTGGPGNDRLEGDGGNDTITDTEGTNEIDGGPGFDTCSPAPKRDNCEATP